MKRYIVLSALVIVASILFANLIGIFEIPDSYFYLGLGTYLYTGYVPPVGPFNYTVPQTLFGPVYALISYPLFHTIFSPLVLIPIMQLLLIGLSTWLLSRIITKLFPKRFTPIGLLLFLLLPFNIIYAFFMMSEVVTMFFVMLALYIFVIFQHKKWHATVLVLICSVLVLTRYAFLPIFGLSVLYWLWSKPKKIFLFIPATIGILLISSWVILHVRLYGSPLISTFTGRHLYNNVITAGKFIPKNRDAQPLVQKFFKYTSSAPKLDVPWWDLQSYFAQPYAENIMTEVEIDKAFLAVSLQGMKEYPIAYVSHLIRMAYVTFQTPPYHANVLTQLGFEEKDCSYCGIKMCRFNWFETHCQPKFGNKFIQQLFGFYILGNKAMFPVISTILLCIALLGFIGIVLSNNKVAMTIAGLFIIQHFFQSSSEWVEGRFLIPLYPLYIILIVSGVKLIFVIWKKIQTAIVNKQL